MDKITAYLGVKRRLPFILQGAAGREISRSKNPESRTPRKITIQNKRRISRPEGEIDGEPRRKA